MSATPRSPLRRMLTTPLALAALGVATYVDNLVPRRDVDGLILDSHDFSLHKYPGREGYFMFSVAYGGCREPANMGCDQTADKCGFQLNHTVNVWASPDLSSGSWVKVAEAISPDMRPAGTVYRPKAVWNPNTKQVVAWHNYVHPNGDYAGYAAYTAPAIEGPYTLQREVVNVTVQNATEQCGDYDLFVDPADGTGYAIMGCGFHMWIERLAPNLLDSAGDASPTGRFLFAEYFVEAPALFVRNGIYYAVFDSCCCYCFQGSGAVVHTAPHPLGPWARQGEVACVPATASATANTAAASAGRAPTSRTQTLLDAAGLGAEPTPGQGCQYVDPKTTSAMRAQQSAIFSVDLEDGSTAFVWAGDRWQQSWDGTKGHDPQVRCGAARHP